MKELLKAEDPTKDYNFGEITLGTVKSADGKFNNYYRLIKPMNFDASRKYPVIVYVYGGPHSQMVKNTWQAEMRRWEMYMAQHGYVVLSWITGVLRIRGLNLKKRFTDNVVRLKWPIRWKELSC